MRWGWALLTAGTLAMTNVQSGSDERSEALVKANAATRAAMTAAEADPSRPSFHFHAPAQWMNDPNGPIYYQGWYHVFYQFNPYGDQWGNMHWGHARSRDLVDWEHLPVALWPSKSLGEDHVYSGSTFLPPGGKPTIFYTSIGNRAPEQWAAEPLDDQLIGWRKSPANPVLTEKAHGATKIDEWRDPFLFREGGQTYLLTGGSHEGHGVVCVYAASDRGLTKWRFLGELFRHPDANDVECPNIAKVGDRWILLTSSHGKVESFVGRLDLKAMRFESEHRGVLADNSYASQLLRDRNGRLVHLAWVRMSEHHGWNGCLSLPSVLTLAKDGTILRNPLPALTKLRESKTNAGARDVSGEVDLGKEVPGDQWELVLDLDPGTASTIEIRRGTGDSVLSYDARERRLTTHGLAPVTLSGGMLRLHLFVDRSVLDLYTEGGAVTQVADLGTASSGLRLVANGGTAKINRLIAYRLRAARFDPPRGG